jgi:hypothetical protein
MGSGQPYMISGIRSRRFSVTIPASSGTALTIEAMVAAVAAAADAPDLASVIGCKIDGLLTVGTDRPAITVGDVVGTMLQYVGAGDDYNEPTVNEYKTSFVKAAANSAITAVVVLYVG